MVKARGTKSEELQVSEVEATEVEVAEVVEATEPQVSELSEAGQAVKDIMSQDSSKSKKMIALFELGLDVKTITELMSIAEGKAVRYNFVYNVVSNHCNVSGLKMPTKAKEGKKDQIIEMFLAGKSNKEIAIELKTNYNYVFNTLKTFKANNPAAAQKVANAKAE